MATVHLSLLQLVALGLLTLTVLCTARVSETITAKIEKLSHRRHSYECSRHELLYGQISQDLMPWALKGIRLENMIHSHKICSERPGMYICILIEDGQVFLTTMHNRHEGGNGHITLQAGFLLELYELSQQYKLPNVEFALYVGDEPMKNMKNTSDLGSDHILLAYSKRWEGPQVSPEILIPFSGHFRCFSNSFDNMTADVRNFSHAAIPWESRKQVAITRFNVFCPYHRGKFLGGQDRPCAREVLPAVAAASNGTLDVRHVIRQEDFLSMVQHAQHRYLVSTDGWTASSKLEKYMLMGSTVLKQASPLVAYYYAALTPWVHYVPFYQYHTADILETVAALRANDAQAKAIAQNAYRFARLHLARPARLCYYRELFARMAPLYRYKPSCQDRPMCVPLLEELKYMGWFTGSDCDVHRQLDQIHGSAVDKGAAPRQPYGTDKVFHGFRNYTLFREPYMAHLGLNAARH